jgi:hypothetical protein
MAIANKVKAPSPLKPMKVHSSLGKSPSEPGLISILQETSINQNQAIDKIGRLNAHLGGGGMRPDNQEIAELPDTLQDLILRCRAQSQQISEELGTLNAYL